jgi:nonsense-mediated mRNA decay protein 3
MKDLVEFYIIDIQIESRTSKYAIATAEIAKSNDFSTRYIVRTHLGYILNAGDHAKGNYFFIFRVFNSEF